VKLEIYATLSNQFYSGYIQLQNVSGNSLTDHALWENVIPRRFVHIRCNWTEI